MKTLWALFMLGQILSAGSINHQQESGYYEINPIYPRHPSKERVYWIKALEVIGIAGVQYGMSKTPWQSVRKHSDKPIKVANGVCWGFMIYDGVIGISFGVSF